MRWGILVLSFLLASCIYGKPPKPTFSDLHYGPKKAQVLDFWECTQAGPCPVAVYVHGGGFQGGDKKNIEGFVKLDALLERGFAVAAVNYRFLESVPVQKIIREDIARSIQYLRSRSRELGIDEGRVAGIGSSAGSGSLLWLATYEDLADQESSDPVLRESSKPNAVALRVTQASYDLLKWKEYIGYSLLDFASPDKIAAFYGLGSAADLHSEEGERIRAEMDMMAHISGDDAPIMLYAEGSDGAPESVGQLYHHPNHARAIKAKCEEVGLRCEWNKRKRGFSFDEVTIQYLEKEFAR